MHPAPLPAGGPLNAATILITLGMALVAAERRPELADTILPLVIAATVVFELVGPLCTRHALVRAGEVAAGRPGPGAGGPGPE